MDTASKEDAAALEQKLLGVVSDVFKLAKTDAAAKEWIQAESIFKPSSTSSVKPFAAVILNLDVRSDEPFDASLRLPERGYPSRSIVGS